MGSRADVGRTMSADLSPSDLLRIELEKERAGRHAALFELLDARRKLESLGEKPAPAAEKLLPDAPPKRPEGAASEVVTYSGRLARCPGALIPGRTREACGVLIDARVALCAYHEGVEREDREYRKRTAEENGTREGRRAREVA